MRTNQELRELYKDLDIVSDIKEKRLEWIGHVLRMDQEKRFKKRSESKLEGRSRGRPRLRWLEVIEKNLRQMKFKRWRPKAVDREERASIIKEAQAHRGTYSQGESK
jgi:hypothetical protein